MMKAISAIGFLLACVVCFAQTSPVGLWQTVDDKTGEATSLVRIEDRDGKLFGTIEEILDVNKKQDVCNECKGDKHGKAIEGLEIIENLQLKGKKWTSGTILDPKNGKVYKANLSLNDKGDLLTVRGYIGFSLIGRSQTWNRVE